MQHYFGQIIGGEVTLPEQEIHRLLDVKRSEIGEEIEISASDGMYKCVVASLHPLKIKPLGKKEGSRELGINLNIAFSLLKSDHNELIVLKGTELGVACFSPFTSERSLIKPNSNEDKKLERLRKIAKEGAEQCRRDVIPDVYPYASFKEIVNEEADIKLIAYEGVAQEGRSLIEELSSMKNGMKVLILIGPEGGFSEKEVNLAYERGFKAVSLGKRILRAETAAIYAASIVSALGEAK